MPDWLKAFIVAVAYAVIATAIATWYASDWQQVTAEAAEVCAAKPVDGCVDGGSPDVVKVLKSTHAGKVAAETLAETKGIELGAKSLENADLQRKNKEQAAEIVKLKAEVETHKAAVAAAGEREAKAVERADKAEQRERDLGKTIDGLRTQLSEQIGKGIADQHTIDAMKQFIADLTAQRDGARADATDAHKDGEAARVDSARVKKQLDRSQAHLAAALVEAMDLALCHRQPTTQDACLKTVRSRVDERLAAILDAEPGEGAPSIQILHVRGDTQPPDSRLLAASGDKWWSILVTSADSAPDGARDQLPAGVKFDPLFKFKVRDIAEATGLTDGARPDPPRPPPLPVDDDLVDFDMGGTR